MMESRELVAYLLLALIGAALFVAWRFATRERRAHNRAHRAARRRARARIQEAADRS